MVAVVHRFTLRSEVDANLFQRWWRQWVQCLFKAQGLKGSCLHQSETGEWVAYLRWPEGCDWFSLWPTTKGAESFYPEHHAALVAKMGHCIQQEASPMTLHVVEDAMLPVTGDAVLF